MDDVSLITCSISMERWKSASPRLGTCKVVTGILNKKVMDLEFIRLPVKRLLSSFMSSILFIFSGVAVGNVHDHVINFKYGFFAFRAYPLIINSLLPRISQGRHGHRWYF